MNWKKTLFFAAAAAFIFLCFLFLKNTYPDLKDLTAFIKAGLLLAGAGAIALATRAGAGKPGENSPWLKAARLTCGLAVFAAGIISLNQGFDLYRLASQMRGGDPVGMAVILKALVFFPAGLALVFFAFYLEDSTGRQLYIPAPVYRDDAPGITAVRLAIALALALLEVYLVNKNHVALASVAFIAMVAQLLLVFKFKGVAAQPAGAGITPAGPAAAGKLLAVLMIGASLYFYYFSFVTLQAYDLKMSIINFVIASFLFGAAPAGAGYSYKAPGEGRGRLFDFLYCMFIFILGAAIFSWKLMDIPPGIHGDENMTILMAQRIGGGEYLRVILEAPQYNGMSTLYYLIIALAGKIWGTTIVTGRWFSVLIAANGLVFTYLLLKNIFNRRVAVLASLMLSCFFMYIFYSRNALQWIHVPAIAAVAYYLFFRAMKRGNPVYFIAAGVVLALDLCFYSAGKVAPFVVFSYLALMLIRKETRGQVLANWKGIAVMAAALVLSFSPIIDYMVRYPQRYFERMGGIGLLHGVPSNLDQWHTLTDNIIRNIQMFITESAPGYCHNIPSVPFFDGFVSLAAIAGAGYLVYTWKREASSFIILWLFFGLLPGFLSHLGPEDPYPARTVMSIPAVIIVTALGVDRIAYKIESLWPKILKYVAPLALAYFFIWFSYTNLRNYFVVFNNDPHTQTYYKMGEGIIAKHIVKNPNEFFHIANHFGSSFYFKIFPGLTDYSRVVLEDVAVFEPYKLYNFKNMDTGVIGEGISYKTFPIFREYFPHAAVDVLWDRNFWMLDYRSPLRLCYGWKYPEKTIFLNQYMSWFYMYDAEVRFVNQVRVDIPRRDLDEVFSLKAEFYKDGAAIGTAPYTIGSFKAPAAYDRCVITGLIDAPDYGTYEFQVAGASARVFINGRQAMGPVVMHKGLNRFKADCAGQGRDGLKIFWKPGGNGIFVELQPNYTLNSGRIFGLMATYSLDSGHIYKMLEPAIDYRLDYEIRRPPYQVFGTNHSNISWDGYMDIKEAGVYSFKFVTPLYSARVLVDGREVYLKEDGKDGKEYIRPIALGKGKKQVKITTYYIYMSNYWDPGSVIRFMYKKEGQREFGPVTYDVLSPGF